MNETTALEKQVQAMLSIIHQVPVGIVETDAVGLIKQINPKGVQLLMPFLMHYDIAGHNNMLLLLQKMLPGIHAAIHSFTNASGMIIQQQNYQVELNLQNTPATRHFFFTVNKIDSNTLSFMFDDITAFYEREKKMSQALQDQAVERSKFEMASSILHDIGNAVVGFGSYLTKIKRQITQSDYDTLKNLEVFFLKQQPQLIPVFGEVKTQALTNLLQGLVQNQKTSQDELQKALGEQMNIVTHISEILNLQRQYIKGQDGGQRAKVNIRDIINDCLPMLMATLMKKNISVKSNIPINLPLIIGDKTRLMQVFLNLLKNAAESIEIDTGEEQKIDISAEVDHEELVVAIQDTGSGINPEILPTLFTRGITTKAEGNGLGLANCRSIIESHNGVLTLQSDGPGKGAKAIIRFKL